MIYLNVLESSDPTNIGLFEYNYNEIYCGRSLKNDIIFDDPELPLNYIVIKIIEYKNDHQLIIQSLTDAPYFFVNNKKVLGTIKIKINDVISFGRNKIQVQKFKKTKQEIDLTKHYKEFEQEAKHLRFALEFIEEVIVDLETKNNV